MQHRRWFAAALVATSLGLSVSGCTESSNLGEAPGESARVEPIEGSDASQVILTAEAAERLGVKTEPVRAVSGAARAAAAVNGAVNSASTGPTPTGTGPVEVIPYAAVLYDENGNTSSYTVTAPLTFVRRPVTVERIDGDLAYLSSGPAPGTPVVTVGAVELLGVEYGVEGE